MVVEGVGEARRTAAARGHNARSWTIFQSTRQNRRPDSFSPAHHPLAHGGSKCKSRTHLDGDSFTIVGKPESRWVEVVAGLISMGRKSSRAVPQKVLGKWNWELRICVRGGERRQLGYSVSSGTSANMVLGYLGIWALGHLGTLAPYLSKGHTDSELQLSKFLLSCWHLQAALGSGYTEQKRMSPSGMLRIIQPANLQQTGISRCPIQSGSGQKARERYNSRCKLSYYGREQV